MTEQSLAGHSPSSRQESDTTQLTLSHFHSQVKAYILHLLQMHRFLQDFKGGVDDNVCKSQEMEARACPVNHRARLFSLVGY